MNHSNSGRTGNTRNNRPQPQPPCSAPQDGDYGPCPYVFNIAAATEQNRNFRRAVWTGQHLQVTLMAVPPGGEIGLEIHSATDQFLRIQSGQAMVKMGPYQDRLNQQWRAGPGYAILIPSGTWHNVVNVGRTPLKIYSIYAPPHHPHGTVHRTAGDAAHH